MTKHQSLHLTVCLLLLYIYVCIIRTNLCALRERAWYIFLAGGALPGGSTTCHLVLTPGFLLEDCIAQSHMVLKLYSHVYKVNIH